MMDVHKQSAIRRQPTMPEEKATLTRKHDHSAAELHDKKPRLDPTRTQFRLNLALMRKTNCKYCEARHLPALLLQTKFCTEGKSSKAQKSSEVVLGEYLYRQLRRTHADIERLVGMMSLRGLIKEVQTFKIVVRRMNGKEFEITLDEELQRLGDVRQEIERLEGIPRHHQELCWFAENGEHEEEEESVVAEDATFDKPCTLALFINEDKPRRPNFVAVLFSVLKRMLRDDKYQELRQMIDTLKHRQSSRSSIDKSRELRHQIISVVGRRKMREAMAKAKAELKTRSDRIAKYESLILHRINRPSEDVPPADQDLYRTLSDMLTAWRNHKRRASTNTDAMDEEKDPQVEAMRTILDSATDLQVRGELRYGES